MVTVPDSPNGLPMAIAASPGRRSAGRGEPQRPGPVGQVLRVDLEHGEVRRGVGAHEPGLDRLALLAEADGEAARAVHHVLVGDHVAARRR